MSAELLPDPAPVPATSLRSCPLFPAVPPSMPPDIPPAQQPSLLWLKKPQQHWIGKMALTCTSTSVVSDCCASKSATRAQGACKATCKSNRCKGWILKEDSSSIRMMLWVDVHLTHQLGPARRLLRDPDQCHCFFCSGQASLRKSAVELQTWSINIRSLAGHVLAMSLPMQRARSCGRSLCGWAAG